ncbi:MAG: hypothetical protein DMF74_12915 [Acidobacteria bacterium]|nr:MAG: hypothetical protein DMF74_12915 [Acidobacteriota bacterium]
MSDRTQIDHLEGLLQPDILIELGASVSGPLDLLQLRDCLEERHLSEDGASGQSEPTIERSIQFKAETWRALSRLADQLEERGTPVTPAEVATFLVEKGLSQIESEALE